MKRDLSGTDSETGKKEKNGNNEKVNIDFEAWADMKNDLDERPKHPRFGCETSLYYSNGNQTY